MEFGILGPLEVRDEEGGAVAIAAGRQRAVLAALVLQENEVVSTDRLIDAVWGETPPETAVKALQGYVSQLRKALEPSRAAGSASRALVTRPPGYLLRVEPGALDAHRFERLLAEGRRALEAEDAEKAAATLREALAVWRGPALPEFASAPFARAEIARLEELRLAAVEERIAADLALGRHRELAGELEGLAAEYPLRERPRGQLMLALYRCGRQAEALEEYRRTRQALVEELGLEPSDRLQRLHRAILNRDPALEAPARAGAEPARPRRAATATMDSLVRLDPDRGAIAGRVPVGTRPVAVAVGHGSVWVANADDGTVSRVDPERMEVVRTIGIGAPAIDLAIGPDAVWAANGSDGTVSRIDPGAEAVVETVVLRGPSALAWNTTYAVAADGAAVWVAVGPHELVRVDPETNEPIAVIGVGHVPVSVGLLDGAVWVATMAERALRIEPRTGSITAAVPVGSPVVLATGEDDVWVADAAGSVWCLDPHTGAVTQTIRAGAGLTGLDAGYGALWGADPGEGAVVRVDLASGAVLEVLQIGGSPTDVAVGAGAAWVSVASAS